MPKLREGGMIDVVEYLREEAREARKVGPRRYESWEITITCETETNAWEMTAKWMLRRDPTEAAVEWLLDLADDVSKGATRTPVPRTADDGGLVRFKWSE